MIPRPKKKLRLILTYKCNRKCVGCCNTQSEYLPSKVTKVTLDELRHDSGSPYAITNFSELLLTGGEPLIYARDKIRAVIDLLRNHELEFKSQGKLLPTVVLYTAAFENLFDPIGIPAGIHKIIITLHEKEDYDLFFKKGRDYDLVSTQSRLLLPGISCRINAFEIPDNPYDERLKLLSGYISIKRKIMKDMSGRLMPENEILCRLV